jgi:replicative DNA helicase
MLCAYAGLDQSAVRKGYVSDADMRALADALHALERAPVYIDDSPVLDLLEIRSKARRLKADKGLDLVLIDYLQLIRPTPGRRYDSREREVAEISRGLKQLAKELNIPIVVLAQLNRQVEATADKRPSLSHLRESGALEQDADLVMFLYRKEVYFPDDPELRGKAELILAKHRNGPIGSVGLQFAAQQTRFHDLAKDDPYRPGPPPPPGYGVKVDDDVPF